MESVAGGWCWFALGRGLRARERKREGEKASERKNGGRREQSPKYTALDFSKS